MINTSNITKGGIYTALTLTCIYLSTILPTSKLSILGITTLIIPLSVITTGIKNSIIVYLASSLLSLILIGFKGNVFGYILLFGLFGFVKYYTEIIKNIVVEIILKLLFFNASLFGIFMLYKVFVIAIPHLKFRLPLIILALQVVFLICDYAITLFIAYFSKRFGKLIK